MIVFFKNMGGEIVVVLRAKKKQPISGKLSIG